MFQLAFQFHYGSVKSVARDTVAPLISNFNSTMVRLKDWAGMGFVFYLVHFNSTMVRLKDTHSPRQTTTQQISIPLWFG